MFLLLAAYAGAILLFPSFFLRPPAFLPPDGASLCLSGVVSSYASPAPGGERFALRASGGKWLVTAPAPAPGWRDRVWVCGVFREPRGKTLPGALDWKEYLHMRGVSGEIAADAFGVEGPPWPPARLARSARAALLETFDEKFGPGRSAVISGVVLGEKRRVPDGLKKAFQDSGAMHLLVASGSNVGFVTFAVYWLCGLLRLGRARAGAAALAAAGLYVAAAGFDWPLVRAYLMFSAALAGHLAGRGSGVFQGLTLSALAILLWEPSALFDPGFQLSFAATAGIFLGGALYRPFLSGEGWGRRLLSIAAVSVFAQAALSPLLAFYFHRVSLASVFSNLLLVPLAGALMGGGFLCGPAAAAGAAGKPVIWAVGLLLDLFTGAVRFFAALPFSAFDVPRPGAAAVAAYYLAAALFFLWPALGPRFRAALAAGALAFSAAAALRPGELKHWSFPGRGDSVSALAALPGGGAVLLNPGSAPEKLRSAVLEAGAARVEAVALSSRDPSDWASLEKLAGLLPVGAVAVPFGPEKGRLAEVLSGLERKGVRVARAWEADRVALPGGASLVGSWEGGGYNGRGDRMLWRLEIGGRSAELGSGVPLN